MKKLICDETKCFFDAYEPETIWEDTNGVYEETPLIHKDLGAFLISDYEFVDVFYKTNIGNYGVKRVPIRKGKYSSEYFFNITEVDGFTWVDNEGSEQPMVTTITKRYLLEENGLTLQDGFMTSLKNGEPAEVHQMSYYEDNSIIIYKLIGWK